MKNIKTGLTCKLGQATTAYLSGFFFFFDKWYFCLWRSKLFFVLFFNWNRHKHCHGQNTVKVLYLFRCKWCAAFIVKTCCPPHASPALNVSSFFFYFNLQNVVRAFLSDPVSIPCFFRSHYPLQSSEVKFFLEGGVKNVLLSLRFLKSKTGNYVF